jgi:L-alanine-DL-glutamate epimerase-like enolase superfamily enzyme
VKLTVKPYLLEFRHPFGVSSNRRTHTPTVFIRLEYNGFFGYGEACLPKYLGETTEDTSAFFEKAGKVLQEIGSPFPSQKITAEIEKITKVNNAAKAAIDTALMDLIGKINGKPFYDLLGFGKSEPAFTSCTIGIDDEKMIRQKIEEAKDFKILKIKAGTADDKKLLETIRRYTDKPLYVDVNQGWTDKNFVVEMIAWLKEQNVLLVEQPMPVNMVEEMAWVTEKSILPTMADEAAKRMVDIDKLVGVYSGINIKLMKSAGLMEAGNMIRHAKHVGLKIMLGCMAESSCASSAMAQYMKFADFIDLDAPNLIVNDPFKGVQYEQGKIVLNDLPGIGSVPLDQFFDR